jgi:ubiquinone/menaquinone biosynthesis C-methylase UbiE
LEDELREIERVVKPGGYAIHLISEPDEKQETPLHTLLTSPGWHYTYSPYEGTNGWKGKYWKQIEK